MAKWTLTGKNEGEMIVTFAGSEWANAKLAAINELRAASEEINDDSIAQLALNTHLDRLFKEGITELGLNPAALPDVDLRSLGPDSVTVCFTFALRPEVKVGDYSHLRYKVEDVSVTDGDVEEGVRVWLESKARVTEEGKEPVLPELNDAFVRSQKVEGVTNVEEFRSYIRKTLARSKRMHNQQQAEMDLLDGLLEVTEVDIPDRMIQSEIGKMIQELYGVLVQQGIRFEDYLKAKGQTEEDLINELWPSAEKNVRVSLALEKVARDHGLYPKNDDIEAEYKILSMRYEEKLETVKESIPVEQLSYELLLRNAIEYLKNQK